MHININKAYKRKNRNDLEIEKVRGLFINTKDIKKIVDKTNFVYKKDLIIV